jgi:hypothetical protein
MGEKVKEFEPGMTFDSMDEAYNYGLRLSKDQNFYLETGVFSSIGIERLRAITITPNRWFTFPDCAQLAADTLLTPIEIHSTHDGPCLYLPLSNLPYRSFTPITLQLTDLHFFLVTQRFPRTFPSVYPVYQPVCRKTGIRSYLERFNPPGSRPTKTETPTSSNTIHI